MNNFLTPADIAKDLGTNKNYVYELIVVGFINSSKIGRRYIIPLDNYLAFIEWTKTHNLPSHSELDAMAYLKRRELKNE